MNMTYFVLTPTGCVDLVRARGTSEGRLICRDVSDNRRVTRFSMTFVNYMAMVSVYVLRED